MRRLKVVIGCFVLGVISLLVLAGCLQAIQASIHATPTSGFPPLQVTFDGSGSRGGNSAPITSYRWNFGDGASASGVTSTHTYTEPGTHRPILEVTDSSGGVSTTSVRIVVLQTPVAHFSYEVGVSPALLTAPDPLTVSFDGTSSLPYLRWGSWGWGQATVEQTIKEFQWRFGDGATGTGSGGPGLLGGHSVRHTYAEPGTYEATLIVTCNYGYTDQTTQTIVVGEPDEPDEPDLIGSFAIATSFWQATDAEEEDGDACIDIWGTVTNGASIAAGCQLTATVYDGFANPVGTAVTWPSGNANIAAGATVPFAFLICSPSISTEDVESVEIQITDAKVWP